MGDLTTNVGQDDRAPQNGAFTFQVNIDPASFSRHSFSESMPSWDSWDDRHHYI